MEQDNQPVLDVMDWIQKQQNKDYESNKKILAECHASDIKQAYEAGWEDAQIAIDKWVEFSGVVLSNQQRRLLERIKYAPEKSKRVSEFYQDSY